MKFNGMQHLALTVSDLDRSTAFYEQAFGMRRFGPAKHDAQLVPLVSPGLKDQISLSTPDLSGKIERPRGTPGQSGGIDHFGFSVAPGTPLEKVRRHMVSCGAVYLGRVDIDQRVPSLFFEDPDGYVFQVTRYPRLTRVYVALLPLFEALVRRQSARRAPADSRT